MLKEIKKVKWKEKREDKEKKIRLLKNRQPRPNLTKDGNILNISG